MANRFTWGEKVRIASSAPPEHRPEAVAWVCGIDEIDSQAKAEQRGFAVGATVYLVEFEDGSSVEVEEGQLVKGV